MSLFECITEYSEDIFRNIPSIKPSQNLFDDLSLDPADWEAANALEMCTHTPLDSHQLIQRGLEYSTNAFIDYPFDHLTISRYSDGQFGCWYGSEKLETSIHETVYHFVKGVEDSIDAFRNEQIIKTDRRVAIALCRGLAIDLSSKTESYPWLIDKSDYSKCQEIGKRIADEGHPLLRVKSAREMNGINLVVFKPQVLSNVRDHCYLSYSWDRLKQEISISRGSKVMMLIRADY